MYVDNFLTLSSAQTVTGASAVLSTNAIDLGTARDIGEGEDLYARFQVGTAFAGLTALTLEVIGADDAAFTTNVLSIVSRTIPVASLTAGARHALELPPLIASLGKRYMGFRYTPTGTGTAGTITGDIGLEVQDGQKFYPGGFTVL
jgi:hypothetical protein